MTQNPLLEIPFVIPFHEVRSEHVRPAAAELLEQARAELRAIAGSPGPRTYANTLLPLDRATERLDTAMTVVGHLESVVSTPALREAYNAVQPDVSAFYAGIPLDAALFRALSEYAETEDARGLEGTRKRFLEKTLDDFRRNGAGLDEAGKKRLDAITREFAELTTKYAQNIVDATARFELVIDDPSKLQGLPESAIEAARAGAAEKGKAGWRFTLQAPSLIPLLTYLDDASIREHVYRAYNTRATEGAFDNRPILGRILDLRRQKAELLGYAHFADFVLHDRMAETHVRAKAFVDDLTARARPAFIRENAELQAFRRRLEGAGAAEIRPWDLAYYAEKQRKALYEFDEEELRPYFPLPTVLDGLFELASRLFGIRIERREGMPVWNPSVECCGIHDRSGRFLGAFYLDLFPREEKRGGAWMNGIIQGTPRGDAFSPHLGAICANVTPALGDRPALLTHDEVQTLFHEFGHLLHHSLSRVEVRTLAGTNVAWDFVELPSQIMENWCWERASLDLFARHHQTGEPIPRGLFEKMVRARTCRAANALMRQVGFAAVDLALHVDYRPERDGDVVAYARNLMQSYAPARYPEDYAFIASFGHLFSSEVGYAAGYYSYKWAEVLDADAFTRFHAEGVFSERVGAEFRSKILERGNSEDPMRLYRDFMGREPSLSALLERSGLIPSPAA